MGVGRKQMRGDGQHKEQWNQWFWLYSKGKKNCCLLWINCVIIMFISFIFIQWNDGLLEH